MNKSTKTKRTKKQINEDIKTIREFLKPFSSDFKKNKKSIELLQIIFELESKSEELKLILKIIGDKNFQTSELTHAQAVMLNKKISKTKKEISEVHYSKNRQIRYDNTKFRGYIELITGINPKRLDKFVELEKLEHAKFGEIKKILKKRGSSKELTQKERGKFKRLKGYSFKEKINEKEMDEIFHSRELIITAMGKKIGDLMPVKKKTPKQIAKDEKITSDLKNHINQIFKKNHTDLLENLKEQDKNKDEIKKISNLKDSCETCHQKVSKTYQKNLLKNLEKEKKILNKILKVNEQINSDVSRMEFIVDDGKYLPFKEAKRYVNMLMVKSEKEWNQYSIRDNKLPVNIPKYPHIEYSSNENKEGWVSWSDWLGVKPIKIRSFKETKEFLQKMNINNNHEWVKAINSGMLPADIPREPQIEYKKQWKGLNNFFKKNYEKL